MTRDPNYTDATDSHPDHDPLRAQHLDYWYCTLCEAEQEPPTTLDDDSEPVYHTLAAHTVRALPDGVSLSLTRHESAGNTSGFPLTMTAAEARALGADILRAAADAADLV